jgi:CRISPR-associated protein Cmr1
MAAIENATASYRIITPAFIGGGEPGGAALRAPSFKGVLRFWWRALMWPRIGDIVTLREREAALFGGAGSGQGQSKIGVRIAAVDNDEPVQWRRMPSDARAYTGFGLLDPSPGKARQCVPAGARFRVSLRWLGREDHARAVTACEQAELRDALRMMGLVGGLGGRSRKGWGSIQLEHLDGLGPATMAETTDELDAAIAEMVGGGASGLPPFTAVSGNAAYSIGPVYESADEAHRWLAETYKETVGGIQRKPEREGFGLPRKNAGPDQKARRAGGLFLHVHAVAGGAVPVAVALPGRFTSQRTEPADEWEQVRAFVERVGSLGRGD